MTIDPKEGDAVKEFWFSQKEGNLYAFSPEWPKTSSIVINDVVPTSKTIVTLMGCNKELPYIKTNKGIKIDVSSISIRDLKSQFVFGFKLSNIK